MIHIAETCMTIPALLSYLQYAGYQKGDNEGGANCPRSMSVAVPRGANPPVLGKINFLFCLNLMRMCWGKGDILATYFL